MTVDKTRPEWTDPLGQVYRPGDVVAIATISGRSPQLVIARVEQINRVNSSGAEIRHRPWNPETGKYEDFEPSCTVRCRPLIDGRGFWRSDNPRAVTYSIPGNIVKLDDNALSARREGQRQLAEELLKELSE